VIPSDRAFSGYIKSAILSPLCPSCFFLTQGPFWRSISSFKRPSPRDSRLDTCLPYLPFDFRRSQRAPVENRKNSNHDGVGESDSRKRPPDELIFFVLFFAMSGASRVLLRPFF